MATVRQSLALRNASLDACDALINAGSGPGTVKFFTGTIAATPDTAVGAQVNLGILTLSDPAFGAASAGSMSLNSVTPEDAALDTGTATWARIADSDGNAIIDVSVGATGSGAVIELASTSITTGVPIYITGGSLTSPAT